MLTSLEKYGILPWHYKLQYIYKLNKNNYFNFAEGKTREKQREARESVCEEEEAGGGGREVARRGKQARESTRWMPRR
jgi:hypothetical protein